MIDRMRPEQRRNEDLAAGRNGLRHRTGMRWRTVSVDDLHENLFSSPTFVITERASRLGQLSAVGVEPDSLPDNDSGGSLWSGSVSTGPQVTTSSLRAPNFSR